MGRGIVAMNVAFAFAPTVSDYHILRCVLLNLAVNISLLTILFLFLRSMGVQKRKAPFLHLLFMFIFNNFRYVERRC